MLLISTIFLIVSLSQCCVSYLFIPCNLINWIFLCQLFVGGVGGARVDFQIFASERVFFYIWYLAVFLCVATSTLLFQARFSLGGFLTPTLDFPPLCSCHWRDIAPSCQYKPLSLRKCIFAVAFWDLPESMSHLPRLYHFTCHTPSTFVSALHSQHRFCLISFLFGLSPDLMYFGVL